MLRGGQLGKRATVQTCPEQHCDSAAKVLRVRIVSARKDEPEWSPPAAPTPSASPAQPAELLVDSSRFAIEEAAAAATIIDFCGYSIARAV